jgi:hypothetical protein
MPTGPKGEKRPADVFGKIATGEIDEAVTDDGKNAADRGAGAHGWESAGQEYDGQAAQGNCQKKPPRSDRLNNLSRERLVRGRPATRDADARVRVAADARYRRFERVISIVQD